MGGRERPDDIGSMRRMDWIFDVINLFLFQEESSRE